jgi:hypothetical protein
MAFTFDDLIRLITQVRPSGAPTIEPRAVADADLLHLQTSVAEATKRLQTIGALIAAEIAHRSRRELGNEGLAYRAGFRTPEKLIQQVTGSTGADARKLVRVGTRVAETLAGDAAGANRPNRPESPDNPDNTLEHNQVSSEGGEPRVDRPETERPLIPATTSWHAELDRAVADGRVSVDAADGIRRGLGEPGEGATEAALREACARLIDYAARAHADDVWIRARNERDLLDPAGIPDRERQRRDARYLRLTKQPDGMTRINGLLDPESAQHVSAAFDAITSPRRGGPRFTAKAEKERAQRLLDDPRTLDQILADALVDIVDLAVRKDTGRVFGTIKPTVRIITTVDTSAGSPGFGVVAGQIDPVSPEAVQHELCNGHVELAFDSNGHALHLGRSKRTFSSPQREMLNARDGGCMWPRCDRPPDWCEAHHINEWSRDQGRTDVDDGILLCRSCHLRLHNEHWRIIRQSDADGIDRYLLRPPGRTDGSEDIQLARKNPLLDHLHRAS